MKVYELVIHNPFEILDIDSYPPVIIRKATGAFFNHSAVLIIEDNDEMYIVHAIGKGVVQENYQDWLKRKPNRIFGAEEIESGFSAEQIAERARSMIGTQYDYTSLVWYLPVYLITGKWYGHTEGFSEKSFYCYEFSAWAFGKKGYNNILPVI